LAVDNWARRARDRSRRLQADRVSLAEFRLRNGRYHRQVAKNELVVLHEPWKVTLDLPAWSGTICARWPGPAHDAVIG
jgi:hypothetical protein